MWDSYIITKLQTKGYYSIEASSSTHYTLVSEQDLSKVKYQQVVEIEYELEDGYRFVSSNYGSYNISTNILTIDTSSLSQLSISVTLVVEEIVEII
jgi:hypothetical protein